MFCRSPSRIHPARRRSFWVNSVPARCWGDAVCVSLHSGMEPHCGGSCANGEPSAKKAATWEGYLRNAPSFGCPDVFDVPVVSSSRRLRIVTSASSNPPLSNRKPRFHGFECFLGPVPAMLARSGEVDRAFHVRLVHIRSAFSVSSTLALAGGKRYWSNSAIGIQRKGGRGGESGSVGMASRKWRRKLP